MEEEKYFLVVTEARFKITYVVKASSLSEDDARLLFKEGMLNELSQEFVSEDVTRVQVATPELVESLNLPVDINDIVGDEL